MANHLIVSINLADLGLYSPKWSEIIQDEWMRNLIKNRPDLTKSKLKRTIQAMNNAFPDAEVNSFEELIDELELPDPNDRHVLAAAIKCKADGIVTFNHKDFPAEYLYAIRSGLRHRSKPLPSVNADIE